MLEWTLRNIWCFIWFIFYSTNIITLSAEAITMTYNNRAAKQRVKSSKASKKKIMSSRERWQAASLIYFLQYRQIVLSSKNFYLNRGSAKIRNRWEIIRNYFFFNCSRRPCNYMRIYVSLRYYKDVINEMQPHFDLLRNVLNLLSNFIRNLSEVSLADCLPTSSSTLE